MKKRRNMGSNRKMRRFGKPMGKNYKDMDSKKYNDEDQFENFEEVINPEDNQFDNDQIEEEMSEESKDDETLTSEQEIENLQTQLEKEKKEYMFLMAEFDNFRKRTLKEKSEIIRNAGEQVLKGLLPIVDDFERGLKASETETDAEGIREGMQLIYNKLIKYLNSNGVKAFDPEDVDFDADRHEAISVVPVGDESQKGKILDTVEKGYMIHDKVLRHAKVVVGQ